MDSYEGPAVLGASIRLCLPDRYRGGVRVR
jgi:hypothetical protein